MRIMRRDFLGSLRSEIETLGELGIPTLLAWGRYDAAVGLELGQEMHQLLPGSQLEVYDQAGHLANYECADEFNRLALEFLAQ